METDYIFKLAIHWSDPDMSLALSLRRGGKRRLLSGFHFLGSMIIVVRRMVKLPRQYLLVGHDGNK